MKIEIEINENEILSALRECFDERITMKMVKEIVLTDKHGKQ